MKRSNPTEEFLDNLPQIALADFTWDEARAAWKLDSETVSSLVRTEIYLTASDPETDVSLLLGESSESLLVRDHQESSLFTLTTLVDGFPVRIDKEIVESPEKFSKSVWMVIYPWLRDPSLKKISDQIDKFYDFHGRFKKKY